MTRGAPPQYRNTGRSRVLASCRLPPATMSLYCHGYNSSPPLIFMRKSGLPSLTRTLPYTAKYNSSPIITGLIQIFNTYSTNSTLMNILPNWSRHAWTSMYTGLELSSLSRSRTARRSTAIPAIPNSGTPPAIVHLLFYHHNLCQTKLDSVPA
jgi:hypothetical protein